MPASKAASRIRAWRENPAQFVSEVFKVDPDPWQEEVLRIFPHNQRLAMKAAKGVGKTTLLAWVAWNFLCTRPDPKIAATSITADNLADGLWPEMAKWMNKSEFLKQEYQWTKTRIFLKRKPETWWMSARTWPKGASADQQADTLAGLHADYLLFILDEVGGIPDAVMAAAEAGLSTGKDTKIIMAGNPTHLEGPLYRACTNERDLWHVTEITSDPDSPNRSPRVSIQWAREQIQKYGRDNPWVLVNVFGKFPPSSLNTLLGPDEVAEAMRRKPKYEDYNFSQKRIGVDVARFGSDSTVLFPRQGLLAFSPVEMRNARTPEIAARVAKAKKRWSSDMEFVDGSGGYGAGVIDALYQAGHAPIEVSFAGRPDDDRYKNKRAEMWFLMAEWVKRGGALPDEPRLLKELTSPTYTFQNGKFMLEKKEQIKERIGVSPDFADALALTFAMEEMPTGLPHSMTRDTAQTLHDYDPFD